MILFIVIAYLLGSIPFGLLLGFAVKQVDIREHGSNNIGATNVFRVVGKKWGILALFLDAFKGWIACKLPELLGLQLTVEQQLVLAVAAICGHTFSVWLKFKGGKGVATSLGVFLAVVWLPTLTAFGFWIAVFSIFRIISVASLAAGAVYPFLVFLFERGEPGFSWLMGLSVVLCAFMFYTHRANIGRLRRGEEKKLI